MTTIIAFDYMGDIRAWLRTQPDLAALNGARVFFRIKDAGVSFPLIRLYRVGGGLVPGSVDIWAVRIGLTVWGGDPRRNQGGTFDQVNKISNVLEQVLQHTEQTQIGPQTFLIGASSTAVQAPDPDTGAPRFEVTASMQLQQLF